MPSSRPLIPEPRSAVGSARSRRPRRRSVANQRVPSDCNATSPKETTVRMALVTEAMIGRSIDGLMDGSTSGCPTSVTSRSPPGGWSPPGHSPFELPRAELGAWKARIEARGFRVCALNVNGNPLHPDPARAADTTPTSAARSRSQPSSGSTASSRCPAAPAPPRATRPCRTSPPTPGCPTTLASRIGSSRSASARTGRRSTRWWIALTPRWPSAWSCIRVPTCSTRTRSCGSTRWPPGSAPTWTPATCSGSAWIPSP